MDWSGVELKGICGGALINELSPPRYTLKLPDDDQWGSVNAKGRWNGMVGEVHRNVSVCGCGI